MARIHLAIGAHLAMSPRAQREAAALQEAGHTVTISGIWLDKKLARVDGELMRRDRLSFVAALDLRYGSATWSRFKHRLQCRSARMRFQAFNHLSPSLLGYGVEAQLRECRRVQADLTIVHHEAGMWIAAQLLQEGFRVGVDFEDWFSRDLNPADRKARPVNELERLEGELLARGSYRMASSHALAVTLSQAYDVTPPAVATNAGQGRAIMEPSQRPSGSALRLHWFSQTIGPGRGLELLFDALRLLRAPVQLSLRGQCSPLRRAWLAEQSAFLRGQTLKIRPPVAPWLLPTKIAEHEVGLSLETSAIASRDVCISNKLFHYLASGLAVIATPTQGHREALLRCPEAGILLSHESPAALAEAIEDYARDSKRLFLARRAAWMAASGPHNGEADRCAIRREADHALAT